jgi:hypothetical protein
MRRSGLKITRTTDTVLFGRDKTFFDTKDRALKSTERPVPYYITASGRDKIFFDTKIDRVSYLTLTK